MGFVWMGTALVCTLGFPIHAGAGHRDFDFRVERFEIGGNAPGSYFDEFDDGSVSPWADSQGTVVETGGTLSLRSPGTHSGDLLSLRGFWVDRSVATAPVGVADGQGNFTAIARWTPIVPEPTNAYSMVFSCPDLGANENNVVAIHLANIAQEFSAVTGRPAGLIIAADHTRQDTSTGTFLSESQQNQSISADDITGPILFRLDFFDGQNLIVPAISLDGGSSYHTFNAVPSGFPDCASGGGFGLVANSMFVTGLPSLGLVGRLTLGLVMLVTGVACATRGRRTSSPRTRPNSS